MAKSFKAQFVDWVAQQPPNAVYDYDDPCGCAFHQFLADAGKVHPTVGSRTWSESLFGKLKIHDLPDGVNAAVYAEPHTFGSLARRLAA